MVMAAEGTCPYGLVAECPLITPGVRMGRWHIFELLSIMMDSAQFMGASSPAIAEILCRELQEKSQCHTIFAGAEEPRLAAK